MTTGENVPSFVIPAKAGIQGAGVWGLFQRVVRPDLQGAALRWQALLFYSQFYKALALVLAPVGSLRPIRMEAMVIMHPVDRRNFIKIAAAGAAGQIFFEQGPIRAQDPPPVERSAEPTLAGSGERILFRSHGETPERGAVGILSLIGGERYLECHAEGQISWSCGPVFADRQRIVMMSVEGEKTWEHNVRSHLWIYDLNTGRLEEIAAKDPPAPYMPACALLPGEKRLIVNPVIGGEQRVFTMDLDGSHRQEVTHEGEGFTYCVSLSPDATKLAFHATGTDSYRIYVVNLDGTGRTLVAGRPEHLYFGPTWSPKGDWLLYVDCHHLTDPGHDWADLCIGRPNGSEHRVVTTGQRHWFATSYGGPGSRGSGSNIPQWSPRRPVCTYTRAFPDSRTAWPYQEDRPDTDHFNREYQPELARGGTEICLLDPFSKELTALTTHDPTATGSDSVWDFRATWSPDGSRIAFCRSAVGCPSELWVMKSDGSDPRFLTKGREGLGVDHPVWL